MKSQSPIAEQNDNEVDETVNIEESPPVIDEKENQEDQDSLAIISQNMLTTITEQNHESCTPNMIKQQSSGVLHLSKFSSRNSRKNP